MRAAIYARYSSENQSEHSIEDQIEVCRRYIQQQGWQVGPVYTDRALSGASRFRPSFQQMLSEAGDGRFDILVCEALDRLGRKLADVAELYDRLSFQRIRIFAASTGELTALHVGVLGTMAQLFLSDLREKTWRGQLGRARAGRIPGGIAYGYTLASDKPGERVVNPAEAAIVLRIFGMYAAGQSPREIAAQLNKEKVTGPGGRPWIDTTIRGQPERGTGILNNTLYIGRLEWNRCSYVKDPRTGKRVARVNAADRREVTDVPSLRIIDDALWKKVKDRQAKHSFEIGRDEKGNPLNRAHRSQYLLSGLLRCGCCSGPYIVAQTGRYGCSRHRARGTCDNAQLIERDELEERVLGGLRDKLFAPELFDTFVKAFAAETARLTREAAGSVSAVKSELTQVERRISSMLKAIEDGLYTPEMKKRMAALQTRKTELEQKLQSAAPAAIVTPHPKLAEVYRAKIAHLLDALRQPDIRAEASEILRDLIDAVVLKPQPNGAMAITLEGDLAAVLALSDREKKPTNSKGPAYEAGPRLSVVAGRGFEPLTFRL